MLRRLHDAGELTRDQLSDLYAREIGRIKATTSSGGNFYAAHKARVGTRLTAAVLESTWEGRSPFTEAFRLLDVKSVHALEKLGRAAGVVGKSGLRPLKEPREIKVGAGLRSPDHRSNVLIHVRGGRRPPGRR